jgi:UDP-N-acetylmuramoylalanine--D-glutamate ligase
MDLRNEKVTIMGLGRHGGGVAAARFCAEAGARVTVTDLASASDLADSIAALANVPIEKFTLGQHCQADFESSDVIVVNPAVKPSNPLVEMAKQPGATITSEIELFLNNCPARVIGITGTVGKTTTAAMLAAILQHAGRECWLGGNIGHSLLADLPHMRADDIVVLELSSFQLHWLSDSARWPTAALITNCSPNHLEWHGTWENYVTTKQKLLSHLPPDGFAVLNGWDAEVSRWPTAGKRVSVGLPALEKLPSLRVPGKHNRINAACAAIAARQFGIGEEFIATSLSNFVGLPHRIRYVAEIDGRQFYNDSKSTTPAATIAAINTMERHTWLLLGGADKDADFSHLIAVLAGHCKGVAMFGEVAEKLLARIRQAAPAFDCTRHENLNNALRWCWRQSQVGDAILLSPACPSTDQFRDFAHRGEEFERLVHSLDLN